MSLFLNLAPLRTRMMQNQSVFYIVVNFPQNICEATIVKEPNKNS
jgi:hypothetical protein